VIPAVTRGTVLNGLDVVIMVIADPNIEHLVPMITMTLGRINVVRPSAVDVGRETPRHIRRGIGARFERGYCLVTSVDFHAFLKCMVKAEWQREEWRVVGLCPPPIIPHCPLANPWEAAATSRILDGGREHSRAADIEDLVDLAWLARAHWLHLAD